MVTVLLHPHRVVAGADVIWRFRVENSGPSAIPLMFKSAQLGDVVLLENGVECYRWSRGRLFAQVMGERSLVPYEPWTFVLEGAIDVAPGEYAALGSVACRPELAPARARVVVDPA